MATRRRKFGSNDEAKPIDTGELWRVASYYSQVLSAAGIDHALIGGLAVGVHGRERATRDIDFIVSSADINKVTGSLLGGGDVSGIALNFEGVPIDILFPPDGMDDVIDRLIARARKTRGVPVIPLPMLVLLKLYAGRNKDTGDVVELLKRMDNKTRRETRAFLTRERVSLVDDFDSYVAEADLEPD